MNQPPSSAAPSPPQSGETPCEMVPQQKFIDGVTQELKTKIAQKPIQYGEDWETSFNCPWCAHPMTVSIAWARKGPGIAPDKAKPVDFIDVDVACNCGVPHPCGATMIPSCGQRYRFKLPVNHD